MDRRAFLAAAAAAGGGLAAPWRAGGALAAPAASTVHTVRGPIDAGAMGTTLVHEHVLVDFAGAEKVSRSRYDADEVFRTVLPRLLELRERGCRTLLECTPAWLGRDPLLLRRLSEASGLHLVTNTGYYGAANDIAVPKHAWTQDRPAAGRPLDGGAARRHRGHSRPAGLPQERRRRGAAVRRSTASSSRRGRCATSTPGSPSPSTPATGRPPSRSSSVPEGAGVSPEAYVWVHAQNAKDPATRAASPGRAPGSSSTAWGRRASRPTSTPWPTSSRGASSAACSCRRTRAGTASASRGAARTGRTRSSSTRSSPPCGRAAWARPT
jgi:hypothetical protein